eukprot:CAMPEP_0183353228 /NCGR_PEP_ID=MMETSP0164_2-20130417/33138_1 /TAXON_ID=221442 /ORGANISM="Coccolithus pelagicus ssp braarudi, Strain PLY182g" /LENGTH=192 /DNA_ID=CAMNT_0025525877 /DNA_START=147 /DNA_END=725 /DNA_ORIENTATION=+
MTKSKWVEAPPDFLRLRDVAVQSSALRFFRINDEVMGGKSSSTLDLTKGSALLFEGHINTNGGGFCSCRTLGDAAPIGLQDGSALLIDAAGDGQRHKMTLHTADSWSMRTPSWSHDFEPSPQRSVHRLLLRDFIPSRQGGVIKGIAPLDGANVTGLGFSLSLYTADGKPNPRFGNGPFRLEIYGMREVEEEA